MDTIYSVWLHKIGLAHGIKKKMLEYFGTCEAIYKASSKEYRQFGLKDTQIEKIQHDKNNIDQIFKIEEVCYAQKVHIIDQLDAHYPFYLREIDDAPLVLFVKGQIEALNTPILSIVGSRKCSEYGFEVAYKMARELAEHNITIASGMAVGIDEAAHKGALSQGRSIAVLGTGIDKCYPRQNYSIYRSIPEAGCLVTEYFPGTEPLAFQFPQRNRIISGLAMGLLVVEADIKSGSLISANLALAYNREVFAVPGNITSKLSLGTNDLIKNGAKCVTKIEDILEELPCCIDGYETYLKKNTNINHDYKLAQEESIVYAYVSCNPICLNELFNDTQLPYEIVYTSLIQLETKRLIKRLPGERYVRV